MAAVQRQELQRHHAGGCGDHGGSQTRHSPSRQSQSVVNVLFLVWKLSLLLIFTFTQSFLTYDVVLSVLWSFQWTVKEFEAQQLTRDIADLVDREADLLNRGRPIK